MAGLYVHIPFCMKKCRYCDFPSYAGMEAEIPSYLEAFHMEMQSFQALALNPFATIFIGGGTPSMLSGAQLRQLMHWISESFSIRPDAEITMECNPGAVSYEALCDYRAAGINRLSIGLQSANNTLLKRIGRIHTAEDFRATVSAAKAAGFQNISADIMHGLPGQVQKDYYDAIRLASDVGVTHISAYALILEEDTPLKADVDAQRETLPDDAIVYDMQDDGMLLLEELGYIRYEISNFAQEGFTCQHNINYWENGPYIGLGAGAHSAWHMQGHWRRWENPKDIPSYMEAPNPEQEHRPTTIIPFQEEAFETVMLGLRMTRGISLDAFEKRFGQPFTSMYPAAIARLKNANWLRVEHGHAFLTPFGMDMQNAALWFFIEEAEKRA